MYDQLGPAAYTSPRAFGKTSSVTPACGGTGGGGGGRQAAVVSPLPPAPASRRPSGERVRAGLTPSPRTATLLCVISMVWVMT